MAQQEQTQRCPEQCWACVLTRPLLQRRGSCTLLSSRAQWQISRVYKLLLTGVTQSRQLSAVNTVTRDQVSRARHCRYRSALLRQTELSMLETRCSSTCKALAAHPVICWLLRTAIRRLQCWRQARFCTQNTSIKFRNGNTQPAPAKYQNR